MISKQDAIEILRDYLNNNPNSENFDAYHVYEEKITEYKYCWEIPHTSKQYFTTKDFRDMPIGSGPYLVDKYNRKLYLTGSGSREWILDYNNYRENKKYESRWDELINRHNEVYQREINISNLDFSEHTFDNEEVISSFLNLFKQNKNKIFGSINIFRRNYNEFKGNYSISYCKKEAKDNESTLNIISFPYSLNEYTLFPGPIQILKEWCKLNQGFKYTDNYWVEIPEVNLKKPMEKWKLILNMEIKNI